MWGCSFVHLQSRAPSGRLVISPRKRRSGDHLAASSAEQRGDERQRRSALCDAKGKLACCVGLRPLGNRRQRLWRRCSVIADLGIGGSVGPLNGCGRKERKLGFKMSEGNAKFGGRRLGQKNSQLKNQRRQQTPHKNLLPPSHCALRTLWLLLHGSSGFLAVVALFASIS